MVHELVGDLGFVGVELLVRGVLSDAQAAHWHVLDLGRVTRIDVAARTLLTGLVDRLTGDGARVVLVDPRALGPRETVRELGPGIERFADCDSALEACEDRVLAGAGIVEALADRLVPLAEQDLLVGVPQASIDAIADRTITKVYTAGTVVFDEGDESDGLYLIGAGHVLADVRVRGQRGRRRLSSMAAGAAFGELALVDQRRRSTRIVAIESTVCHVLTSQGFADLQTEAPEASAHLSLAIARTLSQRLRALTTEIATLEVT